MLQALVHYSLIIGPQGITYPQLYVANEEKYGHQYASSS